MKLFEGDCVVIGARDCDVNVDVNLKQVELREHHPWVGHKIKELDISRHTLIVMIRRGDDAIVPNGDTLIKSGDIVFVFSKRYTPVPASRFQRLWGAQEHPHQLCPEVCAGRDR